MWKAAGKSKQKMRKHLESRRSKEIKATKEKEAAKCGAKRDGKVV